MKDAARKAFTWPRPDLESGVLSATSGEIEQIKTRMGELGLKFLTPDHRTPETATRMAMRRSGND